MQILKFNKGYHTPMFKTLTIKHMLKTVGTRIGSVWFTKKDGTERRMTYRLNVRNTKYADMPKGIKKNGDVYNILTVFDVNKITYNKRNRMNGRGAWRTVPLDRVHRMKINGEIYKIVNV